MYDFSGIPIVRVVTKLGSEKDCPINIKEEKKEEVERPKSLPTSDNDILINGD